MVAHPYGHFAVVSKGELFGRPTQHTCYSRGGASGAPIWVESATSVTTLTPAFLNLGVGDDPLDIFNLHQKAGYRVRDIQSVSEDFCTSASGGSVPCQVLRDLSTERGISLR